MGQEGPERDGGLLQERVPGYVPGAELRVDVFIQAELAVLDQDQGGRRGYRLADRSSLEERLGCDRIGASHLADPVALGPRDSPSVYDGNADSGDLELGHATGQE